MKLRTSLAALAVAAAFALPAMAQELNATEQANLATVLAQLDAMHEKDVAKAASFLTDGYIQHNPFVPTGKQGFIDFFTPRWKDAKPEHVDPPVETITQGDLVTVIYKRLRPEPADPSKTYESFWFDTYRVTDGKISEHWDSSVKPPVAPKPAN